MRAHFFAWVALLGSVACSAGSDSSSNGNPFGGNGSGGGGASGSGNGGGGGEFINVGATGNGGPDNADAACKAVVQRAEQAGGRADVIFALDNSGSMTEEALAMQNNMNTFSTQITASGIDAHVVVISNGPPAAAANCGLDIFCLLNAGLNGNGVCIDPPLGAQGACPSGDDTNLPNYMHWRVGVDSHNALGQIQTTFPNWSGMLRPDAAKTFVVVSDDEANPTPSGADFVAWVGQQPVFQSAIWRFSGVFCVTNGTNCANIGTTYHQLVGQTGGVEGDLALFSQVDAQFKAVFDSLAGAIVADAKPVDCAWSIPTPSDGSVIDINAVNVHYTPGGTGAAQSIYNVANQSECTDKFYGWYYDDPGHPAHVVACPQACQVMQADVKAQVEVLFGCAQEEPPVQ